MQSPSHNQQQNDSNNGSTITPINDELQTSTTSQPITTEQTDINEPLVAGNPLENTENEQQIVHD